MWFFFLMVRGPVVFTRFSKTSIKQKDVNQMLYEINWQRKKRTMMTIRFSFSSLRFPPWGKEQIDIPQTDYSLPVLLQLFPHPSLPFSGLWEENSINSINWTFLSNGSGWVMSVEITAGVKGLEKREVDLPPAPATPILGVKSLDHVSRHNYVHPWLQPLQEASALTGLYSWLPPFASSAQEVVPVVTSLWGLNIPCLPAPLRRSLHINLFTWNFWNAFHFLLDPEWCTQ